MEDFFNELRNFIVDNVPNDIKEISFKYKFQTGEVEEYKFVLFVKSESSEVKE